MSKKNVKKKSSKPERRAAQPQPLVNVERERAEAAAHAAQYRHEPDRNPPRTIDDLAPLVEQFPHLYRAGDYSRIWELLKQVVEQGETTYTLAERLLSLGQKDRLQIVVTALTKPNVEATLSLSDRAELYALQGRLHIINSHVPQTIASYKHALSLYEQAGDVNGAADVTYWLAEHYEGLRQVEPAIRYQMRLHEFARKQGDWSWALVALNSLYHLYKQTNQPEAMSSCREVARTVATAAGDIMLKVEAYDQLAGMGDDTALADLQQVAVEAEQTNDTELTLVALDRLLSHSEDSRDHQQSIAYLLRGLAVAQRINDQRRVENFLSRLSDQYDALEQYEQAVEYQRQRLILAEQLANPKWQAETYSRLADLYRELGKRDEAITSGLQEVRIWGEQSNTGRLAYALQSLADSYTLAQNYRRAAQLLGQAASLFELEGNYLLLHGTLVELTRTYYRLGLPAEAAKIRQRLEQLGSSYPMLGRSDYDKITQPDYDLMKDPDALAELEAVFGRTRTQEQV